MDTHNIHGTDISFHDSAKHTVDFLKHGLNHEAANKFFDQARETGKAQFMDPNGHKFSIEHDKVSGGFSVKKVEHEHFL
jgi:hypothetical protein